MPRNSLTGKGPFSHEVISIHDEYQDIGHDNDPFEENDFDFKKMKPRKLKKVNNPASGRSFKDKDTISLESENPFGPPSTENVNNTPSSHDPILAEQNPSEHSATESDVDTSFDDHILEKQIPPGPLATDNVVNTSFRDDPVTAIVVGPSFSDTILETQNSTQFPAIATAVGSSFSDPVPAKQNSSGPPANEDVDNVSLDDPILATQNSSQISATATAVIPIFSDPILGKQNQIQLPAIAAALKPPSSDHINPCSSCDENELDDEDFDIEADCSDANQLISSIISEEYEVGFNTMKLVIQSGEINNPHSQILLKCGQQYSCFWRKNQTKSYVFLQALKVKNADNLSILYTTGNEVNRWLEVSGN